MASAASPRGCASASRGPSLSLPPLPKTTVSVAASGKLASGELVLMEHREAVRVEVLEVSPVCLAVTTQYDLVEQFSEV